MLEMLTTFKRGESQYGSSVSLYLANHV